MSKIALGLLGIAIVLSTAIAPAYASPAGTLTGSGSGSKLCETTAFPADITFNAASSAGTTSGTFSIFFTSSGGGSAPTFGVITGGHISDHHYRLEGLRTVDTCSASFNTPVIIEGACGTGVTITYKVLISGPGALGGHFTVAGTFVGTVTCT